MESLRGSSPVVSRSKATRSAPCRSATTPAIWSLAVTSVRRATLGLASMMPTPEVPSPSGEGVGLLAPRCMRDSENLSSEEEQVSAATCISCVVSRFLRASNQEVLLHGSSFNGLTSLFPSAERVIPLSENPKMTRCQKCQKLVRHPFGTFGTPLDCTSRNSRSLPQCRVEAKSCGRPPAGLDRLDSQPAELFEHGASATNLFRRREFGPVPAVDRPCGVAIAHVPIADTLQQRSRCLHRRVLRRGVEPCGVGL